MTGSPGRWLVAVVAVLSVLGLGGCASSEGDRARTAADDFVTAVHDGDGGAACAVLAPATVEELEQSSGSACADAVLEDAVEAGQAGEHQPFRVDVAGPLRERRGVPRRVRRRLAGGRGGLYAAPRRALRLCDPRTLRCASRSSPTCWSCLPASATSSRWDYDMPSQGGSRSLEDPAAPALAGRSPSACCSSPRSRDSPWPACTSSTPSSAAEGLQRLSWTRYVTSSDFGVDVAENWQSEYLQFLLYVVLTVWLLQRGSPESKELDKAGARVRRGPEGRSVRPGRLARLGPRRRLAHWPSTPTRWRS